MISVVEQKIHNCPLNYRIMMWHYSEILKSILSVEVCGYIPPLRKYRNMSQVCMYVVVDGSSCIYFFSFKKPINPA